MAKALCLIEFRRVTFVNGAFLLYRIFSRVYYILLYCLQVLDLLYSSTKRNFILVTFSFFLVRAHGEGTGKLKKQRGRDTFSRELINALTLVPC